MSLIVNIPVTFNKENLLRAGKRAGRTNFFVKSGSSKNLRYYITDAIIREFKFQIIDKVPNVDADAVYRASCDGMVDELASEAEHYLIEQIKYELNVLMNS